MVVFWAASFPLVAAALLGVLLCYGLSSLITWIAKTLGNIPLIFGISIPLGNIFYNFVKPVDTWLIGVAVKMFDYLTAPLIGIANTLVGGQTAGLHAAYQLGENIAHLHNTEIPREGRAAANTAVAYSDDQLQLVRTEIHAAQAKWETAHSYADAVRYINLEASAPSVEHAFLAAQARTLIAADAHAQDLHDQLRDYIGRHITGQADVALPYTGRTLAGVAGDLVIPGPVDLSNIDVQDIIKTGSQIAVGTAVAVIATKIVECLVSKCAGNNNFGNLLQDALGIFSLAEFAVFLEALVKDPAGTLSGIEAAVAPVGAVGVKTADDVWGDIAGVLGL